MSTCQVFGDPAIQFQWLAFRELGIGFGSAEEHQRLDDPAKLDRTPQRRAQDAAIFLA